jgi:CDGSH-type Zn-finger protein
MVHEMKLRNYNGTHTKIGFKAEAKDIVVTEQ